MPTKKNKKTTWNDLKKEVVELDHSQMVDLIKDLYRLSKSNSDFLHARFSVGDDLISPYKKIVGNSMHPDIFKDEPVKISRAKKAISDYSKATGDEIGIIDIMIFFVESGNNYTLQIGDIDQEFYNSLCSMYAKAVENVISLPEGEQEEFRERLRMIMESSLGIGWGYHDDLCDSYYKAFPEEMG